MLYLESMHSEIYEEHYNNGQGEHTGCGGITTLGGRFRNVYELIKHIHGHYNAPKHSEYYSIEKDVMHTSVMKANHSQAQNGGWHEPTKEEIAQWEAGEIKLYTEDITIYYHEIKES